MDAFFSGSLLIETIFSLDGLGLLSLESVLNRDYPVVFGNSVISSRLLGLVVNLDLPDLAYMWVDPRIDFESARGMRTGERRRQNPEPTACRRLLGEADTAVKAHRFALPSP